MKNYKIPVSWEMYGFIEIEAESLEEAIEIFDRDEDYFELPDGEYIDASFKREDFEVIEAFNSIKGE